MPELAQALAARIGAALPSIAAGAAVIVAFVFAAFIARGVVRRVSARVRGSHRDVIELGATVLFWLVLGFGLISGFGTMGVDVGALIAGLGLTGFALGFALRDAVANVVAGGLVMLYRPFQQGDRIEVAGMAGHVLTTNLRYTVLQGDGKRFLIPNQTLFNNPLTIVNRQVPTEAAKALEPTGL